MCHGSAFIISRHRTECGEDENDDGHSTANHDAFHYWATGVTPAMFAKMVGKGSQYAAAFEDSSHHGLDGSKTYEVHLPPNIPAKDNWSFTLYHNQARSCLQTDQRFPSANSFDKGLVTNPDGSTDVWFGPKLPLGAPDANWAQTIPGKGWNMLFRLYGPLDPWFDKTWHGVKLSLCSDYVQETTKKGRSRTIFGATLMTGF